MATVEATVADVAVVVSESALVHSRILTFAFVNMNAHIHEYAFPSLRLRVRFVFFSPCNGTNSSRFLGRLAVKL